MNQRIKKLKERLNPEVISLLVERSRLVTESYKETEGEDPAIRQAEAQARIFDQIPIFIEEGELIVGNVASQPMGIEMAWGDAIWPLEDLAGLETEGFMISEEDKAQVKEMNEYWKSRTFAFRAGKMFDDERLWPFMQSGVTLPPWADREKGWGGFGGNGMGIASNLCLLSVRFEEVLENGLSSIIASARKALSELRFADGDSVNRARFLKAVIIVCQGLIRFAERFAVLAGELASKERDPVRKKELERIAETCRWVPAYPARSFHEAMQSFWFTFLAINPNPTASLGRFDQFMYPFYENDVKKGKVTDEEVVELLECLRIKDMELSFSASRVQQREKNAGMAKWHNMVIGGQTAEGKDAVNRLSYLILDAAKRCPTPHHTITVRVHAKTPEEFMVKALEVVRTGIGLPAFVGDHSYIAFLLNHGVPLEKARDYALAGCLDTALPGESRIHAYCMTVVPLIFDFFLHNGTEPRTGRQIGPATGDIETFKTFEDFLAAFKKQLAYFMEMVAEYDNIFMRLKGEALPYPFESALMDGAIKTGKHMFERSFPFENGAVLNAVGMINVADSLAAVKKLVFDEKKITMKQLKKALDSNWEGYEEIRKLCLEAPKFGNNDDYVDEIAKELYKFWAYTTATFASALGGTHKPAAISISAQWPGGTVTGATPDGRYAGGVLADGSMSSMRGMDTHGPTSVMKSAMKIDQDDYQATLLNMKFHPSALKTEDDLRKLSALIKTYFANGGKHVQFNVVNRQTMLDAQIHPDRHKDLVVRVAGYSAYFVQLGKVIQDEVIGRTEHESAA